MLRNWRVRPVDRRVRRVTHKQPDNGHLFVIRKGEKYVAGAYVKIVPAFMAKALARTVSRTNMHVVVVGAGPSGLILSLLLARGGVKCTLLDAGNSPDERPRATHYEQSAIQVLRQAGVLEDLRTEGYVPGNIYWRRLDHSVVAEMRDSSQIDNPDCTTILPLGFLVRLLYRHVQTYDNITVHWSHPVTDVGQDDNSAFASGTRPDGSTFRIEGDYVCGTDGGRSTVRKSLFGRRFEGFSWERQLIAANVYLSRPPGFGDTNFIMHPEHHAMVAKITRDGMWRVTYSESADLPFEEALERLPFKFRTMLRLEPDQYKVATCYPYRIHQRCAEKFRVGRICLAADAAHIVNPHGGLGLNGGIVDVGGLSQCLVGIAQGKASVDILDKYDEVRRKLWHDVINPISTDNMKRVASDPDAKEDPLMLMFKKAWHDDEVHKQIQKHNYLIAHDFTQYYDKSAGEIKPEAATMVV